MTEPRPPATTDAPHRTLTGAPRLLAAVLTAGVSLYALYWVIGIVQPQIYRVSFLLLVLVATFLLYPARARARGAGAAGPPAPPARGGGGGARGGGGAGGGGGGGGGPKKMPRPATPVLSRS
ncbi:MAG: hypothetical protein OXF27_13355, partial [Acidobacteria bacterium]|nr:hypothetical protein [Acidobacteriota bacterium]